MGNSAIFILLLILFLTSALDMEGKATNRNVTRVREMAPDC